ncbi:hypothetical protein Tco_0314217, partial [Tanacetum coccineum]
MHFRKASPFGLVSMYRKNRDRHCAYHPVASIGGRSLEPAAISSSSYMGLISASSTCASFPDLLLESYSFNAVPLLSVSTKLASNALLESTLSSI